MPFLKIKERERQERDKRETRERLKRDQNVMELRLNLAWPNID